MPFVFPWENPLLGLFPDECISFNIKRPPHTVSAFHRTVVTVPPHSDKGVVIPSVIRKVDADLLKHLKKVQRWQKVKGYSFECNHKLFSLLWKFRVDKNALWAKLKGARPLKPKVSRVVKKIAKKHRSSLESRLRPGNVFLLPDRELTFNNAQRSAKPYARYVLLYAISSGQVMIIPFSTQIKMMDPNMDILFDQGHVGPALNPDTRPMIENYPYRMFSKRSALCVSAIQPFTVQDFLAAALAHIGAVRLKVLDFIAYKLKNIQANP